MNYIPSQKQEPINIKTKSINQYLDAKSQAADEIQRCENFKNSIVVLVEKLLSKQANNIDMFFTSRRHSNIVIYHISQSYFHLPKKTIRKNSNINVLLKETLRDIILLFHDMERIDMKLQEWKKAMS